MLVFRCGLYSLVFYEIDLLLLYSRPVPTQPLLIAASFCSQDVVLQGMLNSLQSVTASYEMCGLPCKVHCPAYFSLVT